MIVEILLNLIYNVLSILLTPFSLVFQPLGSMAGLIELFAYGSIFMPLTVLGQCLVIWLGYYGVQLVITLINWLISKIPMIE